MNRSRLLILMVSVICSLVPVTSIIADDINPGVLPPESPQFGKKCGFWEESSAGRVTQAAMAQRSELALSLPARRSSFPL